MILNRLQPSQNCSHPLQTVEEKSNFAPATRLSVLSVRDLVFLALLTATAVLIVMTSSVRKASYYNRSDPHGALLTAQSILQYGTIRLDHYGSEDVLKTRFSYRVIIRNGHAYYYFPVGTSLVALPFVACARFAGMDMANVPDDLTLQGLLAALSVSLIALLSYSLCRFRLREIESLLLATIFVFGTSIAGTCGTALWSFNFEVVFILLALNLLSLILQKRNSTSGIISFGLGTSLFMAYLCRPSAGFFIVGVLAVLFLSRSAVAAKITAFTLAMFIVIFISFSLREYHSALPPYYQLTRLAGTGDFKTALYGLLLSPSRGLLVFSPHLLFVLPAGLLVLRRDRMHLIFAYAWMLVQLLSISRFPHWWGGHSFGARLLTDITPALLLIAIGTVAGLRGRLKVVFVTLLVLTGVGSIAINTGQGLYNRATIRWNFYPEIDPNPEYLFDWRYPQFMATPDKLEERMRRHLSRLEKM